MVPSWIDRKSLNANRVTEPSRLSRFRSYRCSGFAAYDRLYRVGPVIRAPRKIFAGRNSLAEIAKDGRAHVSKDVKLECSMIGFHATGSPRPCVKALFKDGADSFVLPFGSTLEDLAERIDGLGARHAGAPVAIRVQFDLPVSPRQQS
jgi:hypothetical protein